MEILSSLYHSIVYESAMEGGSSQLPQPIAKSGQHIRSSQSCLSPIFWSQLSRQCAGSGGVLMLAIALLLSNPLPSQAAPGFTLRFGQQGQDVIYVQSRLKTLGFFAADTTGYFGPITEAAVIRFQQANNLMVDGIVGPQTLTALNLGGQPVTQPAVYYTVTDTAAVRNPVVTTPVVATPAVGTTMVAAPTVTPVVTVSEPSVAIPPAVVVSVPTVSVSTGSIGGELYTGSEGPVVRELQQLLKNRGLYLGPVTGYYGSLTAKAVQDFQRSVGIEASGITGRKTLEMLRETI